MTTAIARSLAEIVKASFEARGQIITEHEISIKGQPVTRYVTNCSGPNHKNGDQHPSLHFWETQDDNGKTVIAFNCFSGHCTPKEILQPLNLDTESLIGTIHTKSTRPTLTLFDLADYLRIDWQILFNLGWHDGIISNFKKDGSIYKERGVVVPYYYPDGSEFERQKIRLSTKKTKYASWMWSNGDAVENKMLAYGLHHLNKAEQAGFLVLVEGESDYATLYSYGIPALGIPGANNVEKTLTSDLLPLLQKIPVIYIIQETTDAAGVGFPYAVKKRLATIGYTGELRRVPLKAITGCKDPNQLHKQLYDEMVRTKDISLFKTAFAEALEKGQVIAGADSAAASKPAVWLGRQLDEMRTDTLTCMEEKEQADHTLFVQTARLIQVGRDENNRPFIMQMAVPEIKNAMTASANFYRPKTTKDGDVMGMDATPPKEVAESILALNPSAWPFPALKAVVETPVIRPDGSILDQPGYDPATCIYYAQRPDMKKCIVPDEPTEEERADALKKIQDIFSGFMYSEEADRANALALAITPFVRPAIKRHIPLALIDAPKQGSGKGLKSDVVSILATGDSASIMTAPESEEEWAKQITSKLLQGSALITIDNIPGRLHSAKLDAVLTATTWEDRLLGGNKMVKVPQQAVWVATGNNIRLGGDLARRCYRIRLDPHDSKPWQRSGFQHEDLATYVTENRAELISAILTLIRAWFVAGKPEAPNIPKMGTFSEWAKVVGSILAYAGVEGFLGNLDKLFEDVDDENAQWALFLQSWHTEFGSEAIPISKLLLKMDNTNLDNYTGFGEDAAHIPLVNSIPEYLQTLQAEKPKSFSVILGKMLEKRLEACFGEENFSLHRVRNTHTKQWQWSVQKEIKETIVTETVEIEDSLEVAPGVTPTAKPATEQTQIRVPSSTGSANNVDSNIVHTIILSLPTTESGDPDDAEEYEEYVI